MKNLKNKQELNELKNDYLDLMNINLENLLIIIEDWELEINNDVEHLQYEILEQYTKSIKALIDIIKTKNDEINDLDLEEIFEDEK